MAAEVIHTYNFALIIVALIIVAWHVICQAEESKSIQLTFSSIPVDEVEFIPLLDRQVCP